MSERDLAAEVDDLRGVVTVLGSSLIRLTEALKALSNETRTLPGSSRLSPAWHNIDSIIQELEQAGYRER